MELNTSGVVVPDQKTQKYDRQLRLWATTGQVALESSRILLITGTATGTEVLKNLVLPGIGSFTVLDNARVTVDDIGNNFFVRASDLGCSRAKVVAELLSELNEDVDGQAVEEDPVELIERNPLFFERFTLIIVAGIPSGSLLRLSRICAEHRPRQIPLIEIKTCGFVGLARILLNEHTVVESHPENPSDLRLDAPWPELIEFVNSFPSFENMESIQYSHIPYVAILLQYLLQWRETNNKDIPTTNEEKSAFRSLVLSGIQHNKASDLKNWDEAKSNIFRVFNRTTLPSHISQTIFKDPRCNDAEVELVTLDNFWIIARAVKSFVDNEGQGFLPLSGKIPDQKSDTDTFVKLQNIYQQKAQSDFEIIKSKVHSLLSSSSKPTDSITDDEIFTFCKNSPYIKVLHLGSFERDIKPSEHKIAEIARRLENPDNHMSIYLLFRAVDQFYDTYRRYPATHPDDIDTDMPLLKKCLNEVLKGLQVPSTADGSGVLDEWLQEFSRAGSAELHNIAAFVGGVIAQEAIKLITHQYVPMNNTLLFNGVKSSSIVLNL